MKKRKKIIISLLLTIAILFGMTLNVKATTISVDASKQGTTDPNSSYVTNQSQITVNGIIATDTLSAYKVLDVYYNSATNIITYEFTADFKAFLAQSATYKNLTVAQYYQLTSGSITSGSTTSSSTLDTLVSAYAAYIKQQNITGTAMQGNGTVATLTADAGTYLILPTATTRVYAVMVGNLDFTASGSSWELNQATIVAKVSDASITKSIASAGQKEGSFNIGTDFSYIINSTIPVYPTNATNRNYKIVDTPSTGISLDTDYSGIIIKNGEDVLTVTTDGTIQNSQGVSVGTMTLTSSELEVQFDTSLLNYQSITMTYKARLNTNAVLGDAGNDNTVCLTYSNDPYGTNSQESCDNTTAFTYGLELFKYTFVDAAKVALSGATFDVYADADLTKKLVTLTTDTSGYAYYQGLAEGTYYLKEVTAPTGYTLLTDPITLEINTDQSVAGSQTGYFLKEIANTKIGLLPSTGGMGIFLYVILGMILMVVAISCLSIYRKRKNVKRDN